MNDDKFWFRCSSEKKQEFFEWCKIAETTAGEMLRELIEAIPERRITIKKSEEKNKNLKELYK